MSTKGLRNPNLGKVRPTTGKVVESLVATLRPYWEGARVLDLFAGSGSLGLAALEAGCREVVWVEGHTRVARALHNSVKSGGGGGVPLPRGKGAAAPQGFSHSAPRRGATGGDGVTRVVIELLPRGLERLEGKFDIVLADPPYGDPSGPLTMAALGSSDLLTEETVVVLEHHHKDPYLDDYGSLRRTKVRRFGETALSYYCLSNHREIE